jgi:demethylmenaquinone methyltransferase/2-methoxy-6-polyprenyl-1,4-benzoquinol methylase
MSSSQLVDYYSARASEYEEVYDKPERQSDLRLLDEVIPAFFSQRHVLEVACGTGYWTRRIATRSASILGCDLSEEVLRLAAERQPSATETSFVVADAFALESISGDFDAAFVGFWWSHVLKEDLQRFLRGLHRRLPAESPVMIVDNRFVAGSNWPVIRTDQAGNTYQRRRLRSGAEYDVLKNFPSPASVADALREAGGESVTVHELEFYWYAIYRVQAPSKIIEPDSRSSVVVRLPVNSDVR